MDKEAFIPLYLNNDILNKLYTIAVNVFVETKSVSTKNLVSIAVDTPLSELTCDNFGRYMQGNLHLQLSNESSRQNTQEKISIQILILMELMDILSNNNVLKKISNEEDLKNIQQNDYVELSGKLNLNPTIDYFENMIKVMEVDSIFNVDSEIKQERIDKLKSKLDEIKKISCLKYVVSNICDTDACAAIPIINNYLGDNLYYALDSNVKVLGKIVKIVKKINEDESIDKNIKKLGTRNEDKINLCTGTCLDFLEENHINNIETFSTGKNKMKRYNEIVKRESFNPIMEIVPIAIYV